MSGKVIIGSRHGEALGLMEAERFEEAARLLTDLHGSGGPWIAANDLALCLSMLGEESRALELLSSVLSDHPGNGFALINRFYVEEAAKIRTEPATDPRALIREVKGDGPEDARITVVMPTFNRPEEIRESMDSVLAQTMLKWELIVVNDGGGREVEKTMEEYLHDPRVRYVYAEHGGLSCARNAGMALAKGEYITQLDDDDVFYPDHLETVSTALHGNPEARVVYTDFYRARQEMSGGEWTTVKRVLDYSHDFSRGLLRHSTIAPVCNLTHHREALETIGYYNPRILRAMDWDYFIRLSGRYDFLHVNKITGEFRQRSDRSQMTRSFQLPRNYFRNLISFLHGFFPLTGTVFSDKSRGSGIRLKAALDAIMAGDPDEFFMRRLELRKLISEPYYALFYTLGKRLAEEGHPEKARAAFRAAAAIRPWEIKTWIKLLSPSPR